jgi:hypothetical protein
VAALLAARRRYFQDALDEPTAPVARRPTAHLPPQHGMTPGPLRRMGPGRGQAVSDTNPTRLRGIPRPSSSLARRVGMRVPKALPNRGP